MSNQRPPGGLDDPTHDPERERSGGQTGAPQPWIDPNRTQRYSGRRSIADRLRGASRDPDATLPPPDPEPLPEIGAGSTLRHVGRAKPAASAQMRSGPRRSGGMRLVAILAGVV